MCGVMGGVKGSAAVNKGDGDMCIDWSLSVLERNIFAAGKRGRSESIRDIMREQGVL
jgi:hypothetical protein